MNPALRRFEALSTRAYQWWLLGALVLNVGSVYWLGTVFSGRTTQPNVFICLTLLVGIAGVLLLLALYRLHMRGQRLRRCAPELHDINHLYRDTLFNLCSRRRLGRKEPPRTQEELFRLEVDVLRQVCQKIANIFWHVTGRKCVVTVKLVIQKHDLSMGCFTWAGSDRPEERKEPEARLSTIDEEHNPGFFEALKLRRGYFSYFHGADLRRLAAENLFRSDRPSWESFYASSIVVPIRHVERGGLPDENVCDNIGLLCVDTESPNRLNPTYHVQLLAAFADQMYNFMNILRENYELRHREELGSLESPLPRPTRLKPTPASVPA